MVHTELVRLLFELSTKVLSNTEGKAVSDRRRLTNGKKHLSAREYCQGVGGEGVIVNHLMTFSPQVSDRGLMITSFFTI